MRFSGKILLAFNQNKMPKLDVDDQALHRRMLVVEHRTVFYQGQQPAVPHAFPLDSTIKERLSAPAMLHWMMVGLDTYKRERFCNIPPQLEVCRRGLISDQDEVAQWVEEHSSVQDGQHFTLADAYRHFISCGGQVAQRTFKKRIEASLAMHYHPLKRIHGHVNPVRNVFWDMEIV